MNMVSKNKWAVSLLTASLFLAGCGGGGDESSTPPSSEQPQSSTPENALPKVVIADVGDVREQTEFTLTATASDEDGSVEADAYNWSHNSSLQLIEINSSTATPTFKVPDIKEDIDIEFTVTVTDDKGGQATDKQVVTVKRRVSSVTITGIVTDEPIANAQVFITAGQIETETQADDKGLYSSLLLVDEADEDKLVQIRAVGPQDGEDAEVEFVSQLSSVAKLVEQAGDDGELTKDDNFGVNITNVSTAEYVLLKSDDIEIETDEQLQAALSGVDAEEKLELASLIKIAVDKDVPLPEGVETTLELISDEQASEEFKETALEKDEDIIEETKEEIKEDDNLVNGHTGELAGSYLINSPIDYSNKAYHLELLEDGKAVLYAQNKVETTWQQSAEGLVTIQLDSSNPLILSTQTQVDSESGTVTSVDNQLYDLSFKVLAENDIFKTIELAYQETSLEGSDVVTQSVTTISNMFDKSQTITLEDEDVLGTWSIQAFANKQTESLALELTLSADGKGSIWQLDDNVLSIIVQNGQGQQEQTHFWLTKQYSDAYQFVSLSQADSASDYTDQGLMIKHEAVALTDAQVKGVWQGYEGLERPAHTLTVYDNLSAAFGLNAQQWQASLTQNTLTLTRYMLNGTAVDSCDSALTECVTETKAMTVLASNENQYFVNYTGSDLVVSNEAAQIGALAIFNYQQQVEPEKDGFNYAMFGELSTLYFDNGNGQTAQYHFTVSEVDGNRDARLVINGQSYAFRIVDGKVQYQQGDDTFVIELQSQTEAGLAVCVYKQGESCSADNNANLYFDVNSIEQYKLPELQISGLEASYSEKQTHSLSLSATSFDGSDTQVEWIVSPHTDIASIESDSPVLSFTSVDITEEFELHVTAQALDHLGQFTQQSVVLKVVPNTLSLTVEGVVTDEPINNAQVSIMAGGSSVDINADETGAYSAELIIDESEAAELVTISAKGEEGSSQAHVEFKSLLPAFDTLKSLAGDDGILNKDESFGVNVTNVSTAEYALIQQQGLPSNEAELSARLLGVDAEQKLALAALIKAVVDHGVELPVGVGSTLELINNAQASTQLTESIEQNNPELLSSILEDIKADPELLSGLKGNITGDYFINSPNFYTNQAIHIKLEEGGVAQLSASNQVAAQWQIDGSHVEITFDEQQPFYIRHWHSEGVLYQRQLTSLNFAVLAENEQYKTIEWQWNIKRFEDGVEQPQEQGDNDKSLSNLFDKQHTVALTASDLLGTWSLQSYNDNNSNADIVQLIFAEDGTIIDADGNAVMLWQLIDNKLQITYEDEGVNQTIELWLTKPWGNGAAYQFTAVDTNTEAGQTMFGLMVKHADLFVAESEIPGSWRGFIGHHQAPFDMNIDDELNVRIGLQNYWSQGRYENGVFYRERYFLNGNVVGYCDESLDGCSINRRMTFRFLNKVGEQYYVYRTYLRVNELGGVEVDEHSLFIFDKRELDFTQFTDEMFNTNAAINVYIQNSDGSISSVTISSDYETGEITLTIDEQIYAAELVNGTLQYTDAEDNLYILEVLSGDFNSMQVCWYQQGDICDEAATLFYDLPSFTVSTSTDGNGVISPEQIELAYNAQTSFTITPNSGYRVEEVLGCDGELAGNIYTVSNPTQDCQIEASFVALQDSDVVSDLVFYNPEYYRPSTYHVTLYQDNSAQLSSHNFHVEAHWFVQDGITTVVPHNEVVLSEFNYLSGTSGYKQVLDSVQYYQTMDSSNEYSLSALSTYYYSSGGNLESAEQSLFEFVTPAYQVDDLAQTLPSLSGEYTVTIAGMPKAIIFNADGVGSYKDIGAVDYAEMNWQVEDKQLVIKLDNGDEWHIDKTKSIEAGLQTIVREFAQSGEQLSTSPGLMIERGDIALSSDNFSGYFQSVRGEPSDEFYNGSLIFPDGHIGTLMADFSFHGEFENNTYIRKRYYDAEARKLDCDPELSITCVLATKFEYRLIKATENRYFYEKILSSLDFETGEFKQSHAELRIAKYRNSTKVAQFEDYNVRGELFSLNQEGNIAWHFGDEPSDPELHSLQLDNGDIQWMHIEEGKLRYTDTLDSQDYYLELIDNDKFGITICRYLVGNTCQEQEHINLVKEAPVYTVTVESDGNGQIGNGGSQEYAHGSGAWLSVNPNQGYELESISGCNGYLDGNGYRIDYITNSCTVTATFKEYIPLSELAGITDSTLATCVDNSAYRALEDVTSLNCSSDHGDVTDLTGLSSFANLTSLSMNNLAMSEVDLTSLPMLTRVHLGGNRLTQLWVADPSQLQSLSLDDNDLNDTSIVAFNLGQYSGLTYLNLSNNNLTLLDTSVFTQLIELDVSDNALTQLLLQQNLQLSDLRVGSNALTELDLSANTQLISLDAYSNSLEAIDLSANTHLNSVGLSHNQLKALNFLNHENLTYLSAWSNQLENIDVSGAANLQHLDVEVNQLSTLDVTANTQLTLLWLDENPLTTLDLSNNILLRTLYIEQMPVLNHLDITFNTLIDHLDAIDGHLETVAGVNFIVDKEAHLNFVNNPLSQTTVEEFDRLKNEEGYINLTYYFKHEFSVSHTGDGQVIFSSESHNDQGSTYWIELQPAAGYEVGSVSGCENNFVQEGNYLTVGPITAACTLQVEFVVTTPLSEQAGITDPALAQCVNGLGIGNIEDVTELSCSRWAVGTVLSLEGLDSFTNLASLQLGNLEVGEVLDFSALQQLTSLDIHSEQPITSFTVFDPSLLRTLKIFNRHLADLDLSEYINLIDLELWKLPVSSLNLASQHSLQRLQLVDLDELQALDLQGLSELNNVSLFTMDGFTDLYNFDVSKLEVLYLPHTPVYGLDFSAAPNLERLDISGHDATQIDMGQLSHISVLEYRYADLSQLDFTPLVNVIELGLASSNITNFNYPYPEKLQRLSLENNQIAGFNASLYANLVRLNLHNNPLTFVDLSANANLTNLRVNNTHLVSLDLSGNQLLTYVNAQNSLVEEVTGIEQIQDKYVSLYFESNPLQHTTVTEFERLRNEEGYVNLFYSVSYPVSVSVTGSGGVSSSLFHLDQDDTYHLELYPDSGHEVGTVFGCDNNFVLDGYTLTVGPITAACEIQVEFVESIPLSEKAGVTDPMLAECVNNSGFTQIEDVSSLWCGWSDSDSDVSVLEQLAPFNNLVTLSISNLPRGSSVDLSSLQALRDITLSHSKVVGLTVYDESLIHALNLESNGLTDIDLQSLDIGRFVNLQELGLAHNELESPTIDEALPLTTLDLSYNNSIGEFAGELPNLSVFENLQVLRINGLRLRSIDYSHLTQLHTYHHADAGLTAFNTASLPNLANLNLMSNPLNEGGLFIHKPEILVSLNVAYTKLTQLDTSLMTNLNELYIQGSHIQSLDLTNNTLLNQLPAHDSYLQIVSGIEFIANKFAHLDFTRTALTDETLSYVEALQSTYHNLFVSRAYLAEIHIGEGGSVDYDFLLLYENEQRDLWLSIDEGKEVASIQGCPGEFKGDYYELGPLTQNCRLDIVLQDEVALSIKAGIADNALATCVDESGNRYLELTHSLSCWNSEVTSLAGLESFSNLSTLNLGNLNLGDEIDLSHIPSLKEVSIDSSIFTSIKVADPSVIEKLELTYSDLQSYDLSAYTGLISLNLSGNDGITFDLSQVPNLKTLNLNNMSLDSLDLSYVNQLEHLSAYNNLLTDIDISHLNQLTYLDISSNDLTAIAFTAEQPVSHLNIANNELASLDVSALYALNHLNAGSMPQLTSLVTGGDLLLPDPPALPLDYINISDSGIVNPDFTHLSSLRELDVSGMPSENVDFAKLGNMNYLRMDRSNLTSFDTAWVPSVERLSLQHNKLTQINLTNSEKLVRLMLGYNELTQIDTSGLVNLGTLWIEHNPISELDLSNLEKLWQLGLSWTDITEIDVNTNLNLEYITAGYSGMTYIHNLESLRYKLWGLRLPQTPLSTEMQTNLDELSQQEGYGNITYSFAHSVVIKTNEFGSASQRRANTTDGTTRSIGFTPNEGYKLGAYSGCENMQYQDGLNWLNIGPVTQSCELLLEFVPID